MLIALLILVGSGVAILSMVWFSSLVWGGARAVPVALMLRGDGAGTSETDSDDPDVFEPGVTFETDQSSLLETIESIDNIVSERAALFSDASPDDDLALIPGGKQGDGRMKGDGSGLAGPPRRWEVEFGHGMTVEEYAAVLDYFGIELAVLRPGGKVVYVSQLATPTPSIREGGSKEEKRYYLTWLKGNTESADRELLVRAGVPSDDRLILKFLPPPLEAELQQQEFEYAKRHHHSAPVKGSFFRVLRDGDAYRFHLYYQLY